VPDPESPPEALAAASMERWQEALTRRVKSLARLGPLHEIEAGKNRRALDLAKVDVRALALRVLDLTIEEMGVGRGAPRAAITRALSEMVLAVHPELGDEDARQVGELVVDAMLNESGRRQAFVARYVDWSSAVPVRRDLEWRLLREFEHPDGGFVLGVTTEGINLYTGMLEFDVQDAQVAEEAVLRAQIKRGRLADALRTAQNARLRSIEYQELLGRLLRVMRRDIAQVSWTADLRAQIDDARAHIDERLHAERELSNMLAERVDSASVEDAPRIAELRDELDECQTRHLQLFKRLQSASQVFLEEQERQVFRPAASRRVPDLEAEVLLPALSAPAHLVAALGEAALGAVTPPVAPTYFYLPGLVDRLLKPRPEARTADHLLARTDLDDVAAEAPYFTERDHADVEALLAEVGSPTPLGALLEVLGARGASARAERLLVLRVLHGFEGSAHCVEAALGHPRFHGDDVIFARPERGA
jgi:hypothetical protein